MWSAIAKIFTKNSGQVHSEDQNTGDMDTKPDSNNAQDSYDTRQAKQRASVKWLLSKAFNNKVPENLKEPFYRDHENQEHLKPQIIGALANAEIYCLALGNIYSDPNYNNLNHWAILQTLSRKGIYVAEPSDGGQLTETTLIQTNPLRMNAHMAVIEAIMSLYAKEVVTTERVLAAINRFSHERVDLPRVPDTHEECMLVWVRHTCDALKKRIDQELQCGASNGGEGDRLRSPELPAIKELPDLCDGVGLSALISYYCSEELPWKRIRVSYLPSVQDSLHNLGLVQDFCERCLPASIFHMMPEDVTYMRGSMKQNLVVFLADLFNLLEINPAKCVRYAGMERPTPEVFPAYNAHGVAHKRNLPQTVMSPIPDLRSGLDDPANPSAFQVTRSTPTHTPIRKTNSMTSALTDMTEDSLRREEAFVVHRGRNIPTLSSVLQDDPNVRLRSAEKKAAQDAAAGKPSNWDENKKSSFAGRRSRRNSVTEDSQLTIENFGGSQDNLNFIGRNPDKEVGVHVTRKISAPAGPVENPAVRSSLKDAQGSFQLGYDNGCEKVDDEREKYRMKRQLSSDDIALRKSNDIDAKPNRTSFAEMHGKQKGIQLVYTEGSGESGVMNGKEKKTTTFAALPNTTTWQQQSSNLQQEEPTVTSTEEGGNNVHMASQLNDIRLKLEEKRRHIENEKRKMELAMNKQRQKVGKAAFLQAVVKGKGSLLKTQESDAKEETDGTASQTSKPKRPVSLKEISDDVTTVEKKWFDDGQMFVETRRTPDFENMDLEQYQQSIAQMNSSLHDIQTDIQRLASQQNQIQMAQQHELVAQRQKWLQFEAMQQQQQQLQSMQPPQTSFVPHTNYSSQMYPRQAPSYNPLQSSASAPHIPQSLYGQHQQPQNQFFLHDQQPTPPQRRTWAQQAQLQSSPDPYQHHPQPQPELRTWAKPLNPSGFVLHDASDRYHQEPKHQDTMPHTRYQNGGDYGDHRNTFTLSQQHAQQQQQSYSTPSASPQHVRTSSIHRQISQLLDDVRASPVSLQQMEAIARKTNVTHAPIPAPPADDMEPQNISFIGSNSADKLAEGVSRLNITSGTRTYRIPSPTRPLLSRTQFQQAEKVAENEQIGGEVSSLDGDANGQKGFYISFDNEQPKRPKPPLRMKRASPKKERSQTDLKEEVNNYLEIERLGRVKMLEKELEEVKQKQEEEEKRKRDSERRERYIRETSQENERQKVAAASAIIIGNDLSNPDPDLMDERERKKEKILMMSLQRRQRQEELKERKEQEAQLRREREKEKEEERARKKEEQAARRAAILEQYKLKKAIEEAEREGKTLDKPELLSSLKPVPKLRTKATMARPRPKTIHIDSGSVEIAEGMMQPARGKKGSSSNLTANSNYSQPSTMRRDYYRGSQDSLADRGIGLYKDSPDDSRGMSPCHSANQTLGRRSSYKTSREPSPAQVRGRPKYSTYQNFKGRKSNSMMNLYGSSIDQDSMAYRYGDTDSGLGRATPPRRAPSPGMGGGGGGGSGLRHLPSPSGPGSLPGFMSKRRVFDDGSSDISSTPSSMLDYSGPRLYKQPATKSNRGIMLNAVEYCVFPGAVNKEAKRRVLEEIARSESKHFLILFRDAGCQFRALYSYCPDREEVCKLYGTGPKQVNDRMFDKFFKYNSGGKCFSQVHTKHLTVTIDAFTIHNSLWQGKKVNLPNKKDMALVI